MFLKTHDKKACVTNIFYKRFSEELTELLIVFRATVLKDTKLKNKFFNKDFNLK